MSNYEYVDQQRKQNVHETGLVLQKTLYFTTDKLFYTIK